MQTTHHRVQGQDVISRYRLLRTLDIVSTVPGRDLASNQSKRRKSLRLMSLAFQRDRVFVCARVCDQFWDWNYLLVSAAGRANTTTARSVASMTPETIRLASLLNAQFAVAQFAAPVWGRPNGGTQLSGSALTHA
uniref:Uncharacterized protein n=1 Tax=Timema monikensis TaxID=170555 RepID=A0A7R9E996_9NEOP|nr:unnamed protein product [Timema monikensis]